MLLLQGYRANVAPSSKSKWSSVHKRHGCCCYLCAHLVSDDVGILDVSCRLHIVAGLDLAGPGASGISDYRKSIRPLCYPHWRPGCSGRYGELLGP